jgi:molecular chaperone GrpE
LRDLPQPGSAAANPGDPANAGQPVTATVTGGSAESAAELAAARQQAAERTADLQRITAEYANYRKRVERDKQHATVAGKAAVMADLLGVLDDVDRADAHGDLTGAFKTVTDKLVAALQRLGLAHYGAVGDEFDPNLHEAVQFATSPEVDHPTVTAVLRVGYLFDERVLRPAVVGVTGPEHEAAVSEEGAGATRDGQPSDDGRPGGDGESGGAGDRAASDASGGAS